MPGLPAMSSAARRVITGTLGLALLGAAGLSHAPARAADADQSITVPRAPGEVAVDWTGTIPQGASVLLVGDPLGVCDIEVPTTGDRHTVQVTVPANLDPSLVVTGTFSIDWDSPNGGVEDEKLVVLGPDGKVVGDSDTGGQSYESTSVTKLVSGVYTVIACPFQNPAPKAYNGQLSIRVEKPNVHVATGVMPPTYAQFTAPADLAEAAGEPSIGSNWKTDATMFQANQQTMKVAFDDKARTSEWKDVTGNTTGVTTLDPILFTDSETGRTFVSQLLLACSAAEYTDSDGEGQTPWIPSQGCGVGTGIDHQTVGGGPYPEGTAPLGAIYPNAVYYCTNGAAAALCASSVNGGITFGSAIPAITTECGVLHGHLRVAPDGTVYLPSTSCNGRQGLSVSEDQGVTWTVKYIPDSLGGLSDPSVSAGKDGTVYYGYSDGSGRAKIAVSTDKGDTWSKSVDVGAPFGINNTEFAEVIAGDGDRAAFAFLGTPTDGYSNDADFGKAGDVYSGGTWHMYVATTYDAGKTWTTVDSTPTDPVQRGCMWNHGGGSSCRNLLDFNDITIDKIGRVMVGFADGCTAYKTPCATSTKVEDNSLEDHGAIIRQLTGRTLFSEFDGTLPAAGAAPAPAPAPKPTAAPAPKPAPKPSPLPATGAEGWLPVLGAALLVLAVVPHRRRARA